MPTLKDLDADPSHMSTEQPLTTSFYIYYREYARVYRPDDSGWLELWVDDNPTGIPSADNEAYPRALRCLCLDDQTFQKLASLAPGESAKVYLKIGIE